MGENLYQRNAETVRTLQTKLLAYRTQSLAQWLRTIGRSYLGAKRFFVADCMISSVAVNLSSTRFTLGRFGGTIQRQTSS